MRSSMWLLVSLQGDSENDDHMESFFNLSLESVQDSVRCVFPMTLLGTFLVDSVQFFFFLWIGCNEIR